MRRLLALAALLALGAAPQPPLPLHVGGRVIKEADGALAFGWPGTYFEGRFAGTGVRVRLDAPAEYMRLLIDGEEKLVIKRAASADLTVEGLANGEHVARLEKLTESQSGGGRFLGFFPVAGDSALTPLRRAHQIEFIGDSYTVGYGNNSAVHACPGSQVHDTTDTQQAFGPLVAKRFDADYRINAYSGFGIVRIYAGGVPDSNLPNIYARLKPDAAQAIETASADWQPQIIVINLGTNDFSTPVKPGERWKNQSELQSAYRTQYVGFVRRLRAAHPKARFILMGSDLFFDQVQQVANDLRNADRIAVSTVHFAGLDLGGCDFHPSLADHRLLAKLLEQEIDRLAVW